MPKRKKPQPQDLTNEKIEQLVFPKKVRDAIHRIAETDKDDEQEPDTQDAESSRS